MALKNTIGSYFIPGADNHSHFSKSRMIYIQTGSSTIAGFTAGAGLLQTATAAKLGCDINKFHLTSISFGLTAVTATAETSVWLGTCRVAQVPTGTSGQYHISFGPWGLTGPDNTNTASVSIVSTVGGASLQGWAVTGYYEV